MQQLYDFSIGPVSAKAWQQTWCKGTSQMAQLSQTAWERLLECLLVARYIRAEKLEKKLENVFAEIINNHTRTTLFDSAAIDNESFMQRATPCWSGVGLRTRRIGTCKCMYGFKPY